MGLGNMNHSQVMVLLLDGCFFLVVRPGAINQSA